MFLTMPSLIAPTRELNQRSVQKGPIKRWCAESNEHVHLPLLSWPICRRIGRFFRATFPSDKPPCIARRKAQNPSNRNNAMAGQMAIRLLSSKAVEFGQSWFLFALQNRLQKQRLTVTKRVVYPDWNADVGLLSECPGFEVTGHSMNVFFKWWHQRKA